MNDTVFTSQQVCELLQISYTTLLREIHTGRIPYVRIGRRLRFFAGDILNNVRERQDAERMIHLYAGPRRISRSR